jgi:tetratricopeptide (TPR) repeat protein
MTPRSLRPLPALALLLLPSCGGGEDPGGAAAAAPRAAGSPVEVRVERDDSEGARALRRALEFGDLVEVEGLLDEVGPALGVEEELLRARLALLLGDDVGATTRVEAARRRAPEDPRVYATSAELNAAAGRLETAREEIERGAKACGMSPELLRARGVLELCRQGGAAKGLDLLGWALEHDPDLPFVDRPRGQAHLLLAKAAMSEGRKREALLAVTESLSHDPGDLDARLFLVDALATNGDFPRAVRVLEELCAEGHDRRSELALMYKRAAMGELILGHRDLALEYFVDAREAGLTEDELGSGAEMLRTRAEELMREGVEAFGGEDLEAAAATFEEALRHDPTLLVARAQLAVTLYRDGKPLPAATQWRRVLDEARAADLELPDPVHLHLARALVDAGEPAAARQVLEQELELAPAGRWAEETRALLAALAPEPDGGR